MNQDLERAIVWAALAKIADKESRRELLGAGQHDVELAVTGRIGRRKIDKLGIAASLAIGEDQTRGKSLPVPAEELLGYLLGQLTRGRRASLLRDLPQAFAAAGGRLPDLDPERTEEAKGLLARLVGRTEQTVRGSVACKYSIG
jgi:hypothetical protein